MTDQIDREGPISYYEPRLPDPGRREGEHPSGRQYHCWTRFKFHHWTKGIPWRNGHTVKICNECGVVRITHHTPGVCHEACWLGPQ